MTTLHNKYDTTSNTYIQLMIEKNNGARMFEKDSVIISYINKIELLAINLTYVRYLILDKIKIFP